MSEKIETRTPEEIDRDLMHEVEKLVTPLSVIELPMLVQSYPPLLKFNPLQEKPLMQESAVIFDPKQHQLECQIILGITFSI